MASAIAAGRALEADVRAPFAWPNRRPFLTAEWRNLVMLNFEIDPAVLEPFVPSGVELDYWEGATFASIVGFQFLNTRLAGLSIPYHQVFEEVNLRFYVRRKTAEGWRRGVTFVRELAPKRMVALVARLCYGENYLAVPMSHRIESRVEGVAPRRVEYAWKFRRDDCHVAIEADPDAEHADVPAASSHEEFIVEHYWGYSSPPGGRGKEYEVAHPRWRISPAAAAEFQCDVAAVYGRKFAPFLTGEPVSAFWVDGSAVRVYPGTRIAGA